MLNNLLAKVLESQKRQGFVQSPDNPQGVYPEVVKRLMGRGDDLPVIEYPKSEQALPVIQSVNKQELPQILPPGTPQQKGNEVDDNGLPVIGAPGSFEPDNKSSLNRLSSQFFQSKNDLNARNWNGGDGLPQILPLNQPNVSQELPTIPAAEPSQIGINASKIFSKNQDLPTIPYVRSGDEKLPLSNLPKGADALQMLFPQEMPGRSPRMRQELPVIEYPKPKTEQPLPTIPAQTNPRQDWLDAEKQLYAAQNKDYSKAQYDNDGNLVKAAGKDRDPKWSFWDKVLSSLIGAGQGLASGGLIGGIVGGVKGGTDRNFMEKLQVQMSELPKAQQRADQARKAYDTSLKLNGAENDETRAWRDDWRKSQKTLEDSHKAFLDTLIQDNVFDENDAKAYEELTGQRIAPFDKRKRETMMRNGDTVERPETGGGEWRPSIGVPTELVKKPVGVTQANPDGKSFTVPMLPKDAGNFQYRAGKDAATAQAQIERDERKEAIEAAKITFKSEADWRKQTNAARSKYNAAQGSVRSLNPSITEVEEQIKRYSGTFNPATGNVEGGYDTSDLQKRLDGLKKQQADYQREVDEASAVMNAEKPKSFTLPARQKNTSRRSSVSVSRDPMGLYR